MNAIAKPFATRIAEQADRLHDASDQLDAMTAKWREREGELRGEALAIQPHEDDGCLDCLRKERGEAK